jgi:hypothetical protein
VIEILGPLTGRTFTLTAASWSHPDRTVTSFRADARIDPDPDSGWPSALVRTRTESLEYEPDDWAFRTHILSAATDPAGTVLVALGRSLPWVESHRLLFRLDPATGRFTEEVELSWLARTPGFADRPVPIGHCQRKVDWDPGHDALGFDARVLGFLREAVRVIAGPFDIPAERRYLPRSFAYDDSPGTTEYGGFIEGAGERVILHQAEDWRGEELMCPGPKWSTWKYEVGGLPWPFALLVEYFHSTSIHRPAQECRFDLVAGTNAIPAVVSLFNSSFPGADSGTTMGSHR